VNRGATDVGADLVEPEQDVAADIGHAPNRVPLKDQPDLAADDAGDLAAVGHFLKVRLPLGRRPPFGVVLARPLDHVDLAVGLGADHEVIDHRKGLELRRRSAQSRNRIRLKVDLDRIVHRVGGNRDSPNWTNRHLDSAPSV
jgi:hypothetical protein